MAILFKIDNKVILVIQLSTYHDKSLDKMLRKDYVFLPGWEAGRISFGVGPEGG